MRYAGAAPGWVLGMRDKFYVADFDDDGKDDLYAFSGTSWGSGYLGMLKSFGNGLLVVNLYPHNLYAGWKMAPHDEHYVGDIDGDGKDDLYVFNWQDWDYAYLGMTKSTGTSLNVVRRYAGSPGQGPQIPGWRLAKGDRFYVSNFGFDRRSDLVVYNTSNWVSKYLGKLVSSGMDLSGSWSMDWVGNWNLGRSDQILVGNYSNVGARPDVFIRNSDYFGMLRGESSGFSMDRIYFHWLYTPLFDSKPWSDSMP